MHGNISRQKEITDRQSTAETAKRWGMTKRRVLQLCRAGKVYAAKMVDGEWTIPTAAVRPVDGRRYRNIEVPRHLATVLGYADAAVRDVPTEERGYSPEALDYFIRGSAFHLHTLETSPLNFGDVCENLAGRAVGGKSLYEQMGVIWHQRAIRFVVRAVDERWLLSVRFVEQLHGLLSCGNPRHHEPMQQRECVNGCVRRVRTLKMHPVWLAADFLVRFLVLEPYDENVERTAYMVANFILMSHGYPPVIIYRAVFRWWRDYLKLEFQNNPDSAIIDERDCLFDLEDEEDITPEDMKRSLARSPIDPTIFASVFVKAIKRSCRLGLMRAIPDRPFYIP